MVVGLDGSGSTSGALGRKGWTFNLAGDFNGDFEVDLSGAGTNMGIGTDVWVVVVVVVGKVKVKGKGKGKGTFGLTTGTESRDLFIEESLDASDPGADSIGEMGGVVTPAM